MNEQYSALRSNVSMLGKVLGDTIKDALGENILDRVETIRKLSKSSRAGNEANRQELLTTLQNLSNDELLPVEPRKSIHGRPRRRKSIIRNGLFRMMTLGLHLHSRCNRNRWSQAASTM